MTNVAAVAHSRFSKRFYTAFSMTFKVYRDQTFLMLDPVKKSFLFFSIKLEFLIARAPTNGEGSQNLKSTHISYAKNCFNTYLTGSAVRPCVSVTFTDLKIYIMMLTYFFPYIILIPRGSVLLFLWKMFWALVHMNSHDNCLSILKFES